MDPKELKIPNICFSCDDGKDEEYKKQRIERGFDDTETYSLFITIAEFTLPRLKRFKELSKSHPVDMSFEEWMIILDKITESLEIISKDDYFFHLKTRQNLKKALIYLENILLNYGGENIFNYIDFN